MQLQGLQKASLSSPKQITTAHKHLGDRLERQIQEYLDFKVFGNLPNRKAFFVSKRQANRGLKGAKTWTQDGSGANLSLKTKGYRLKNYFSLLINDGVISKEEVQFRDLLNYDYLFYYYNKSKEKKAHTASIFFFTSIVSELSDNTYFDTYYPIGGTQNEWRDEREELKKDLQSWIAELKSKQENKDGKRNIRFIIESENPNNKISLIIKQLEKNISTRRPNTKPYMTALKIDLLFNISLFCPLRVKNFSQLQWGGPINSEDICEIEMPCLLWLEDKNSYPCSCIKKMKRSKKELAEAHE